jgi:hypothetical protein
MCYTASDNDLSLFNVSQLKALKEAGFQKDVEVLAYADSNENGVPTRLFNINSKVKTVRLPTRIGDGEDPYVRNFVPDEIWVNKLKRLKGECTQALAVALESPEDMKASCALENFIGYCVEQHPAKHYLLFCMGHGLIVGNDSFLFDANPASGITLKDLGAIIGKFTRKIQRHGALELLCFHSCSMSAVEVSYELKGTARYMIASEGYSYVGSWPYRQLLKKIFRVTKYNQTRDDQTLRELVQRAYELSLYNATDFAFSGYSHDLALCDLAEDKVNGLATALQTLTRRLKRALDDERSQELILLAHLKSQSFWREDYTDIYDFCCCLEDSCDSANRLQSSLKNACRGVIEILKQQPNPFDGLIVFSDNFGWEYQYARGLSIYFPWSAPMGNGGVNPLKNYAGYAFNKDAEDAGDDWLSFLNKYWGETMRPPLDEDRVKYVGSGAHAHIFGSLANKPGGVMNKPGGRVNKPGGGYADSPCICPSIKNFPFITNLYRRRRSWTRKVEEVLKEKPQPKRDEEDD